MCIDIQTYRMGIGTFLQGNFEHKLKHNGRTSVNILSVFFTCLLVALSLQLILPTSRPTHVLKTASYLHGPGIPFSCNQLHLYYRNSEFTTTFPKQRLYFIYQQLLHHAERGSLQARPWISSMQETYISTLVLTVSHQENNRPSILASDMPSGLKVMQWNLWSIAPRDGNTKQDQL